MFSDKEFYPVGSWKSDPTKNVFRREYRNAQGDKRIATITKKDQSFYSYSVVEKHNGIYIGTIAESNKNGVFGMLTEFFKFCDSVTTKVYKPSKSKFYQTTFCM